MPLTADFERIAAFVKARVPVDVCQRMRALGWERDGQLVGGVLVYGWTGPNAWIHVAGDGGHWMTRQFARAVCTYVFRDLGCNRLTATVEASNAASVRFTKHFGFVVEATLEGAARDGGDLLVFVLWKGVCPYVDP